MTPGAIARALAIAFVLPLSGCVLVIGTSPSPFNEAQIIVVVRTHDSGVAIKGAGVAVVDGASGEVLGRGATGNDGRFALTVTGVSALRVVVEAPTGYSVPALGSRSIEVAHALVSGSDLVTVALAPDR